MPAVPKFEPEPLRAYEIKPRCCLMCRIEFDSSWPGERVCAECKRTDDWKNGVTLGDQFL